ncbi:MAG: hypothetical protein V4492_05105 [Chlamydiota bacterium]
MTVTSSTSSSYASISELASVDFYNNAPDFKPIKAEGAQAIAPALMANSNLTSLNLQSNGIGDLGVEAIAPVLRDNSTLTSLDLGSNGIEDPGAEALARVLPTMSTLKTLKLSYNRFGDEGAQALATVLATNSTLTFLQMGCNYRIHDMGERAISQALETNGTLTYFQASPLSFGAWSGANRFIQRNLHNRGLKEDSLMRTMAKQYVRNTFTTMDKNLRGKVYGKICEVFGHRGYVPHFGEENVFKIWPYFAGAVSAAGVDLSTKTIEQYQFPAGTDMASHIQAVLEVDSPIQALLWHGQ